MTELNEISKNIEVLREKMYKEIEKQGSVESEKVLVISHELDEALLDYHRLKEKMNLID